MPSSLTRIQFEELLGVTCRIVTEKLRGTDPPRSSQQFESEVRHALRLVLNPYGIQIELDPKVQQFPDVPIAPFGIEVKFTENDTWRSVANSIAEGTRIDEIEQIYVIFGKLGGMPEARWRLYDDCVIHVRTSHRPRFEIEMTAESSLFDHFGLTYSDFRRLDGEERMEYVRNYARSRLKPGERLWWLDNTSLESNEEEPAHTLPIQARLYKSLPREEKRRLRAEAALLCPSIVKGSRSRDKYDDAALFLLTYHGVVAPQLRDLFSAGSVAHQQSNERGGIYVQRALIDIQEEMQDAATRLDNALFVEYWGEAVPPDQRIKRWLQKADELADGWIPSDTLFLEG